MYGMFVPCLLGCPLAHEDPKPYLCYKDKDCFQKENEYCKLPPNAHSTGEPGECKPTFPDAGFIDQRVSKTHDMTLGDGRSADGSNADGTAMNRKDSRTTDLSKMDKK